MKKSNHQLISTVFICIILLGCSSYTSERELITKKLKDPDSTKFRNENKYINNYVCGEFNSKNSYGGYTGYSRYIAKKQLVNSGSALDEYYLEDGSFQTSDPERLRLFIKDIATNPKIGFEKIWNEYCK